jgi:hypothetical protein
MEVWMKRTGLGLGFLALLVVSAGCTNTTAPSNVDVEARRNGGTVGSGYAVTAPDTTGRNGGTVGSGY